MHLTLQAAIEQLYRITVVEQKATSTVRLSGLADFCVGELEKRGLVNVQTEAVIPGAGREKQWDVAWQYDGKWRLAISLKSLLRNISGTVPNRIDDLMGEVANAQLHSPEIVLGYVMVFDRSQDAHSTKHNSTWLELLRSRLNRLAGANRRLGRPVPWKRMYWQRSSFRRPRDWCPIRVPSTFSSTRWSNKWSCATPTRYVAGDRNVTQQDGAGRFGRGDLEGGSGLAETARVRDAMRNVTAIDFPAKERKP